MEPLLLLVLDAAAKSVVLLSAALALTLGLKRAPARTRQALWGAALGGILLVPLLSPWMPTIPIGGLPRPVFLKAPDPALRPAALDSTEGAATPRPASPTSGAATLTSASPVPSPLDGARRWLAARSAATWGAAVWFLGLAAALVWQLAGLAGAKRLTGRAALVHSRGWQGDLAAARRRLGVTRSVRLLLSAEIGSPVTWGIRRPVILLPREAAGWSGDRRSVVLLHELVHIRRGDWPVRLLARLASAVYWFNPLAWLAVRRLTIEQEMACDEEVLAFGTRPSIYAGHLLEIARAARAIVGQQNPLRHPRKPRKPRYPRPVLPVLDMAWRSQMEGRLMRILDRKRPARFGKAVAIPALLALFTLVPALAAMRAWDPAADLQQVPGGHETAASTVAPSANLGRLLAEMAELESQLEPMERELETIEERLEPIEEELEAVEREMETVEEGLEGLEDELEPFERRLEEVEERLEPHEAELEKIEADMEAAERELELTERELEPFERKLEAIETEMEPVERRMEALEEELEPFEGELERLSELIEEESERQDPDTARLEQLHQQMSGVHESMRPIHHQIQSLHESMRPLHDKMQAVHAEMRPVHEKMQAGHQDLEPHHQRMSEVHGRMEPVHREMNEIHREMEPVHRRMSDVHEEMAPYHQRMRVHHERMEPIHRDMREVHQRMEPIHRQMQGLHAELDRELAALVVSVLETELAGTVVAAAPIGEAAAEILDAASVNLSGGRLYLRSSARELAEILTRVLGPSRQGSEAAFSAAVERSARTVADLDVAIPRRS